MINMNVPEDERTMEEITEIANTIFKCVQFTTECPSHQINGTVLDLQLYVGEDSLVRHTIFHGSSLWCILMWRFLSPDCPKFFPHTWQLSSFTLLWTTSICLSIAIFWTNALPQWKQTKSFIFRCDFMCLFKWFLPPRFFKQMEHLNFPLFVCTASSW